MRHVWEEEGDTVTTNSNSTKSLIITTFGGFILSATKYILICSFHIISVGFSFLIWSSSLNIYFSQFVGSTAWSLFLKQQFADSDSWQLSVSENVSSWIAEFEKSHSPAWEYSTSKPVARYWDKWMNSSDVMLSPWHYWQLVADKWQESQQTACECQQPVTERGTGPRCSPSRRKIRSQKSEKRNIDIKENLFL